MATDTFLMDWSGEVRVETAWRTDVAISAEGQAEERRQLLAVPYRSFDVRWKGLRGSEVARLHLLLAAAQHRQIELPLYCDVARTTASSSGTTINCPTADRRFQVGRQVLIHALDGNGRSTNVQTRTISAVGASTITVGSALTGTYVAGALVYPLVMVERILEADVRHVTGRVGEVEATFYESHEAGLAQLPLDPLHADVEDPSGFPTSGDWPVFDTPINWGDGLVATVRRRGDRYSTGRGASVELRGTRPTWAFTLPLLLRSRAATFEVLRFHDSRRGRLFPFWLAHPAEIWELSTLSTGFVDITAHGLATDLDTFFEHLAVVMRDGTVYVRPIASVTDNTTTFRLTLGAVLPSLSAGDVARVCPAFLCRFADDAITERWVTDEVCRVDLRVQELVEADEAAAALEDVTP